MRWVSAPVRFARDLSIGIKLALTVAGALTLLAGVSWFAFDRLGFVTSMQANVDRLSVTEQQVERSLLAAQELRVISREIEMQQSANGIRTALERAASQTALATKSMQEVAAGQDQPLLDAALTRLDGLMSTVKSAAALRAELLTFRQKRLFQVRPVFENAMRTLMTELANGSAALGGVDSVRDTAAGASADQHDPTIEAVNRYRLAVTRIQGAALMFMATGNGSAVNEVASGTAEATASMAVVLASSVSEAIKTDARLLETIGNGIAAASADLVTLSRKLDQVAGADVGTASEAMRSAFDTLAAAIATRQRDASSIAQAAGIEASSDILMMVGAITLLMVILGSVVILTLGGPIRRLTAIVQMIAAGKTDQAVPYTAWKDEIGRMAASVETLREVMRQTFVQTQMIEQLPVGVMTTEPSGDFRITYVNAEARAILETVQSFLAVPVDKLVGQPIDVFHPDSRRQRALVADPARLPHRTRISLGPETLDLRISAVYDRDGGYAGPLLTWRRATAQARLVHQFEESVGTIARVVASAADGMREAASDMRQSAISAGERTLAVSAASDQASNSVSTAASGADELAVSVVEIGRQVAESAEIAGLAVAAAQATDASVSGLSEAADRISAVVQLISDIAARTNLLALNATIEAARAGEAGKGFAVVAGEVKNLATQTGKATQEIGGQIAAMQQATGQAVAALRSIGGTIQRMNEIATIISASVERQGAATQSIATAVQQAAAGTTEVNSNIAAVSHVVEETGTRAEGVLAAATGMTGQATALKDEVAKFLVAVQQAA